MTNQYDLDLASAWKRVIRQAQRATVPDTIRWEELKVDWPRLSIQLETALDDGSYVPRIPRVIETPKDGFTTWPISILDPIDSCVYEALVEQFASRIDAVLPAELYSARLKEVRDGVAGMLPGVKQWVRFQEAGLAIYEELTSPHMLVTDISSYFEYVDTGILIQALKALGGLREDQLNLLSYLLNTLSKSSPVWGLPQTDMDASSILGNFYLLSVDRMLGMHPVKFIRYQDDIRVFADSAPPFSRALRDVIAVLRGLHLNVATHKTKILVGEEILDEFEDARKSAISYGLRIGDPTAAEELRKLFDSATATRPVSARDVKFAVYRLSELHDPHGVPWILANLAEVPYLASHLVDYLSQFFDEIPEIAEALNTYLLSPDMNIQPFVELQLMRLFGRAKELSNSSR